MSEVDDVSNDLRVLKKRVVDWADKAIGDHRSVDSTLWKLNMEEIPELGMSYNKDGILDPEELGDCLILLLDLCHLTDVDPAEAIKAKMEINEGRTWKRGKLGVIYHVDT
jgi:NTP pyrophosphatase (non-canonical NTP hydrolase)